MPPRSASRMLERRVRSFGFIRVAGVDEVGRGCLAGPVVAAAVVLPDGPRIPGLRDSKLLSAAQRERLFDRLVDAALAWQVASVEPAEIDRINIHQASLRAMRDALLALAPQAGFALVDGFRVPGLPIPQLAIVGGDRRSSAIAAASPSVTCSRFLGSSTMAQQKRSSPTRIIRPAAITCDKAIQASFGPTTPRRFRAERC